MARPTNLVIPQPLYFYSEGNPATFALLDASGPIVIIGANGSGKTRLGVWFEFSSPQKSHVYRIGAQKSLDFPSTVSPISLKGAELGLLVGIARNTHGDYDQLERQYIANTNVDFSSYKKKGRWRERPEISQLNDFDKLLVYLTSEEYEISLAYRQQAMQASERIVPPKTKLDRIKQVWEQVLPHRELVIKAGNVSVKLPQATSTAAYNAAQMSDGERIAFYLIGQCLSARPDSIIVIDEPEIHLHRVIQSRLWDAIEKERPDCLFVYLTHDLDFASSRSEAKKIWVKSYSGSLWDWREVPSESEGLPEEVLLAVLGSRRPVLFTEGDRGGTEQVIFSHLYPSWTIMPRGGCEQVIQATQALRALRHLHGIDSYGIVDLDYRSPQEVASLETVGVHVLNTQEIENLLLVEPVLALVAEHVHTQGLSPDTAMDIVRKVKEFAFTTLARDKDLLASRKTAWEMEEQLHKIDRSVTGIAALERVRADASRFDVAGIYTAFTQEIERIIGSQDYVALLRMYNNKGLARRVGRFFGTLSYPELVKRLINTGNREDIVEALRAAAPVLTPAPVAVT